MKRIWKNTFVLAGISAILAASALSLSSCGSAHDSAIPDGWEAVRTEDNAEYLSRKAGSENEHALYLRSDSSLVAGYTDLVAHLQANDGYIFLRDGNDLRFIYYYGGEENPWFSIRDYKVSFKIKNADGEICYESSADLQLSDINDVRKDADGTLWANHAVRITVPASEFADLTEGDIVAQLECTSSAKSENCIDYSFSLHFCREDNGLVFANSRKGLDMYGRMSFPNVLMEVWNAVLPVLFVLELALFVLSLILDRLFAGFLAVGIIGAGYAYGALIYFEHLPTYGMFGGFEYFGEEIGLVFAIGAFVVATAVFGVIFALVHYVRKKRKAKKTAEAAQPTV